MNDCTIDFVCYLMMSSNEICKDYANGGKHLFWSWWIQVVHAKEDEAFDNYLAFVAAEDRAQQYSVGARVE